MKHEHFSLLQAVHPDLFFVLMYACAYMYMYLCVCKVG